MQATSTNGVQTSAHEALDALGKVIGRLEADLNRQHQEIQELRAARDDAQAMVRALKEFIRDIPEWERINPAEFTFTIDDILADIQSK